MATDATKAVFIRGLPPGIVREAKAAAARRGVTLAAFVAESLARAIKHPEVATENGSSLDRERRWFERERTRLEREYAGEYVAIVGQTVIDHDADFEALAERVFAMSDHRHIFMPLVTGRSSDARVRSPRIAR